jgi:TPR repeat protein
MSLARCSLLAFLAALAPTLSVARDRTAPPPPVEHAASYVEARGMPSDARRGFALMKQLADEGEGAAAVQAQWAVGNFYLNGVGTEPSYADALVYLAKAKAGGLPEAARLLDRIEKR